MRIAVLLLALVAVGCAEKWAKPGAGEQDFRAMEAQCEAYATNRWPPRLRETVMFPARWVPPVRSCDNRDHCVFYGGYYEPPQTMIVDDHQAPRRQERRACFVANGWTEVDD